MTCTAIVESGGQIIAGTVAPYALRVDVESPDPTEFDLSTATAARFEVRRGNGYRDTWSGLALVPTPPDIAITQARIRLVRVLQPADAPEPDTLAIYGVLTTPSGEFLTETFFITVKDRFA